MQKSLQNIRWKSFWQNFFTHTSSKATQTKDRKMLNDNFKHFYNAQAWNLVFALSWSNNLSYHQIFPGLPQTLGGIEATRGLFVSLTTSSLLLLYAHRPMICVSLDLLLSRLCCKSQKTEPLSEAEVPVLAFIIVVLSQLNGHKHSRSLARSVTRFNTAGVVHTSWVQRLVAGPDNFHINTLPFSPPVQPSWDRWSLPLSLWGSSLILTHIPTYRLHHTRENAHWIHSDLTTFTWNFTRCGSFSSLSISP